MNLLEHLQPVFEVRQKLVISLQLVSVKSNVTSCTEEAIKDVMLAGVGNEDIKREFLSTENTLSRSLFEIISFIESKEMGRYSTENIRKSSAVSSF